MWLGQVVAVDEDDLYEGGSGSVGELFAGAGAFGVAVVSAVADASAWGVRGGAVEALFAFVVGAGVAGDLVDGVGLLAAQGASHGRGRFLGSVSHTGFPGGCWTVFAVFSSRACRMNSANDIPDTDAAAL